jgi:hypothetical protein
VSLPSPPWFQFEPLKLLNFELNADPNLDPIFYSDVDPDPASQNKADPDPQLYFLLCLFFVCSLDRTARGSNAGFRIRICIFLKLDPDPH